MTRRTVLNTAAGAGAALAVARRGWSINRWKQFNINDVRFVNQSFETPMTGYLNQLKKNVATRGSRFYQHPTSDPTSSALERLVLKKG